MPARKNKICPRCKHFVPETEVLEAECEMDEDVNLPDWCDSFERHDEDRRT